MTWFWLVLVGWFSIAVPLALLIGSGVSIAERRDAFRRTARERLPLPRTSVEGLLATQSGGRRAG